MSSSVRIWEDWGGACNCLDRCNQAASDFRSRKRAKECYSPAQPSQENNSTSPLNFSKIGKFHFGTRRDFPPPLACPLR
jgi:hypothetical protein